jgi:ubiquinone/menaquinone biosynthesis C-methylase UbiE
MLTQLFHWVVGSSFVYDLSQRIAGSGPLDATLREHTSKVPSTSRVLDVGGGTGRSRHLWPSECAYFLLDADSRMLRGFAVSNHSGYAVRGDALRLPFADASIHWLLCKQVSHHIEEAHLVDLFGEIRRVLKPDGRVLFVDAVWRSESLISKLLWKYDRGSHPRTEEQLRDAIAVQFAVEGTWSLVNNHRYVAFLLVPKTQGIHSSP